MDQLGHLRPALAELKNAYVTGSDLNLEITGKGITTIETFFRKFLTYLKAHRNNDLSTWIDSLDLNRNNIGALARDAYVYIETKRPVESTFNDFMAAVESIENVISFEIHEVNLGDLIDEIFMNKFLIKHLFHESSMRSRELYLESAVMKM